MSYCSYCGEYGHSAHHDCGRALDEDGVCHACKPPAVAAPEYDYPDLTKHATPNTHPARTPMFITYEPAPDMDVWGPPDVDDCAGTRIVVTVPAALAAAWFPEYRNKEFAADARFCVSRSVEELAKWTSHGVEVRGPDGTILPVESDYDE